LISPETITSVKERTDIVTLVGEYTRLQKRGRNWLGLCPFHKEKTPSFNVHQDRGFYHCFGCKESGSVIDFVMKLEGYNFPEAVRALAERCGVEVEESAEPADRARMEEKRRDTLDLYELNQLVASYFEEQLRESGHPFAHHARAELARRGLPLGSDEAIDESLAAFRIGYAPYGWDSLASYLRKQEISPLNAERLGLIVRRSRGEGHYDGFRHRLMFAVVDKSGRVVAFSGRALAEPSEEELQQHRIEPMSRPKPDEERRAPPKYINSAESPIYVKGDTVFGLHQARMAVRSEQRAIVVEGNFDVLSLHARGVQNVVAPLGTAFTQAQAKLIRRYAPEVVVMFDGDAAGKKAAMAMRGAAREAGLSVRVASLPDGADPDTLVHDKGVEAIHGVVKGARGMLEYLINETIGTSAVWDGSRQQTLERIRTVAGFLAEERDPNMRAMAKTYADEVASKLVIGGRSPTDLRALERMMDRALAEPPAGSSPKSDESHVVGPRSRSRPRAGDIELATLGAVFDFPELINDSGIQHALGELEGAAALAVLAVRQMWDAKKSLQAAELLDLMPQAVHSFAVGRLASPKFSDLGEARMELLDNAEKLRRRSLTGDKAVKVQELARAQGQGDVDAEDELLRELERVARNRLLGTRGD
jgi:DNA primase